MTVYLSKQQSCLADLDGRGHCGEVPCSCSWDHQHPNNHHHQHRGQRHHYRSVPGGALLSPRGGQTAARHLDSISSRSPSRLLSVRAKGGSTDVWPPVCSCVQSWQVPNQVKVFYCQNYYQHMWHVALVV